MNYNITLIEIEEEKKRRGGEEAGTGEKSKTNPHEQDVQSRLQSVKKATETKFVNQVEIGLERLLFSTHFIINSH